MARWLPVPGYVGIYEVSDAGDIWSHHRGRKLRPSKDKDGYRIVHLCNAPHRRNRAARVSGLIAEAFLGPRPSGYQICHNDGDEANDVLNNLRYDTQTGNFADKVAHGTLQQGERNGKAKLTSNDVRQIKTLIPHATYESIAAKFNVTFGTIGHIAQGRTWKHIL